ncbi:MAG: hypothetical protein FWC79_03945 [Oscillospiraceae bacterium]|nr:hypothetical protein [Oscillospiraceae bacterium]
MDTGKMKNMIILKNLPSNIVDEAIVILKPNISEAFLRNVSKLATDTQIQEERKRSEN